MLDDIGEVSSLKAKAVVAAHDKDINSLAVSPDDSLVCSGSQVSKLKNSERPLIVAPLNTYQMKLLTD